MFDLKKKIESADDDILSEIIEACEKKMVSPFAKKKVEVVAIEPGDEEEAQSAEGESEDTESKLADADLEELMEMYKSLKG